MNALAIRHIIRRAVITVGGLLLAVSVFNSPVFAKGPGTEAAEFLRIGASGRQTAMGEATVGLADDANSSLWNPSAWGRLRRNEVALLRTEWLEGVSYSGLTYGHSTQSIGNWGASLLWLDVPDFQGYDVNGAPDGKVKASDQLFLLGHGRALGPISLGGNVKFVRQTIDDEQAGGWAGDFGAHWKMPWSPAGQKFSLGAAVRNAGGRIQFIDQAFPLPLSTDIGLGYQAFDNALNVGVDATFSASEDTAWRLGAEYWLRNVFAFRAGFKSGQDLGNGLSLGFGTQIRNIYLDYAFADYGKLEGTHRISVRFRFGGEVAQVQKEALRLAQKDRYVQAIGQLDSVLDYEPHNPQALSQLRSFKQLHQAQTPVVSSPNDPFGEGVSLFNNHRYLSALDRFLEASAKHPEKADEIRRYVTAIQAELQGEQALSSTEQQEVESILQHPSYSAPRLIKLTGSDKDILKAAGKYEKAGQFLMANEALQHLDMTTTDPKIRFEARQSIRKIVEIMMERAKTKKTPQAQRLYSVAFLDYYDSHYQVAISNWQELLKGEPGNAEVRAYLEFTQRNMDALFKDEQSKHLLESGSLHQKTGNDHLAREAWMEAARLKPEDAKVRSYLKEKANSYYEAGKWQQTIDLLEQMKQIQSLDSKTETLLRQARHHKKMAEETSNTHKTATAPSRQEPSVAQPMVSDPALAAVLYQKGIVAYLQQDFAEAIRFWERSVALDPTNEKAKNALDRAYLQQQSPKP